ncbi:MAG: methionine--tRNA ligase [Lachnospiraceae bacterium]|nr:methionine--tRNA ligase [Lachnospiraceae bacterium]
MKDKGKYYITTAIAYTSGKPHIGNCYEIVLADSIARYKRKDGYDVHFLTGSDEHGQKIESRAIEDGCATPKEFVDKTSDVIKGLWNLLDTSYDRFIRTTDEDHETQIKKIFKKLYDQGDIYKGAYEGMYCTECEAFYTNSQLVDGKCPECHGDVHPAKEEAYFFKMSKYADRLMKHIEEHPEFIQPVARKNEMINNFLKPGLQDLCVSRTSFKWGIPVDFDPKHVVYVWLDALCNYITGIGYDADGNYGDLYKKYWPADLHLVGKDIIRFHTIYWPIFLMALGEPLPKQIFGHPWLLQGGEKMSKSKGNVLYADDLASVYGVDAVRYFVLHEMPFDNDGVITWELMTDRFNSDLANTLGNLVQRTISMTNKYFDGVVENGGVKEAVDDDLISVVTGTYDKVEAKMADLKVADSITLIFDLFKRCNKYIDETEPWKLAKDEALLGRLKTVLYNLTEAITIGATLLDAFMPNTAEKIFKELNTTARDFEKLGEFGLYPSGTKVAEQPEMLFARMDQKEVAVKAAEIVSNQKAEYIEHQTKAAENLRAAGRTEDAAKIEAAVAALSGNAAEGSSENTEKFEQAEQVTYDDFAKLQFKVGKIIDCKEVPKSKKLLCSQVQIGDKTVQILSGIKAFYKAEEMVGKKVMVVANLKPAKIAGMESQGMLLCAESSDGKVVLMTPEKDMPSGSTIC